MVSVKLLNNNTSFRRGLGRVGWSGSGRLGGDGRIGIECFEETAVYFVHHFLEEVSGRNVIGDQLDVFGVYHDISIMERLTKIGVLTF